MRNKDFFKNKKVTVVGLARSGLACANLLCDLGAAVSVTEYQDNETTRSNAAKLRPQGIKVELGLHSQDFIRGRDLIVVSPGVTNDSPAVAWAEKFKVPIISEIEFAWILCPATVIAVTGSNGKTTTTTLIGKALEASGKRAFICGNIGNPFCGELNKMSPGDFVSLEASSFQLERIQTFKPKVSVILNFSRNHLDRYANMREYLEAKKRIFMNQDKSDYLVLNYQDRVVRKLAKEANSRTIYFSEAEGLNSNQAATLAATSALGIDKKACLRVFREFEGIEHRLEYVAKIKDIKFINDSKSTTVDSTLWALKNVLEPIVLIAGGRDKGNDYSIMLEPARRKIREIILLGEAKDKMKKAFGGFLGVREASTLEEAVNVAFHKARAGDCVLFSPMCSSFDMFSNYEERGRLFKKAVCGLIKGKG